MSLFTFLPKNMFKSHFLGSFSSSLDHFKDFKNSFMVFLISFHWWKKNAKCIKFSLEPVKFCLMGEYPSFTGFLLLDERIFIFMYLFQSTIIFHLKRSFYWREPWKYWRIYMMSIHTSEDKSDELSRLFSSENTFKTPSPFLSGLFMQHFFYE